MTESESSPHHVMSSDTDLLQRLQQLAATQRVVCFAGLPGTGKSLMMHQLAHLAVAEGRTLHVLQWDVARPVFEAHPAARDYPVVDGVTHGMIRKAVGLWARQALARWHEHYSDPAHLLLGETPFIGSRLIELAQRHPDAAESYLQTAASCFVIPVPSQAVRRLIETRREERSRQPLHQREAEDAPPHVLQALWQELVRVAPHLGLTVLPSPEATETPYNPDLYAQVYQAILRHRHAEVLRVTQELPTSTFSPYDFAIAKRDLIPTSDEVVNSLRTAEADYPHPAVLETAIDNWYRL